MCYDSHVTNKSNARANVNPDQKVPRSFRISERQFNKFRDAVKRRDPEDEWQPALRRLIRQFVEEHGEGDES